MRFGECLRNVLFLPVRCSVSSAAEDAKFDLWRVRIGLVRADIEVLLPLPEISWVLRPSLCVDSGQKARHKGARSKIPSTECRELGDAKVSGACV